MVERGAKAAVLQVRFLPPFTPQYYFQHRSHFSPLILNEVQFIPADAGNGDATEAASVTVPVYPRGCGERAPAPD